MQKYRAFRHSPAARAPARHAAGFTLIELMVTVAVLAILAMAAAPGIRQFVARSEMNALQNDFTSALNRSRSEAVALNTCVSMCQLAQGSTNACNANTGVAGQWEQGWIIFENPTCDDLSATDAANLTATAAAGKGVRILAVRQPRANRYQLTANQRTAYLTYNARGLLQNTPLTVQLREMNDTAALNATDISLSMQGRVQVTKADPSTNTSTAAGNQATTGTSGDGQ